MAQDAFEASEEIDEVMERAALLHDGGAVDEAREVVAEALERFGEHPILLCWLGVAARDEGADGVAYSYFRRCLAQNPTDPAILALAGQGLAAVDDPQAEPTLRLAAMTGPEVRIARLAYGAYLAREGFVEDAVRELEAARDLDPEDAATRGELAVAYLRAGRTEDALEEWPAALALEPEDAASRALFGLVLSEAGQTEAAAEELHRAATEAPDDFDLQLLCALSCAAEGWDDEAWSALARAEAASAEAEGGVLAAVEDCLEAGPEAAAAFLRDELAPSALRERLLRPPL